VARQFAQALTDQQPVALRAHPTGAPCVGKNPVPAARRVIDERSTYSSQLLGLMNTSTESPSAPNSAARLV